MATNAASTAEKSANIVSRLNGIRVGLSTINELLDTTLESLATAQAELNNPKKYISTEKIGKGKNYISQEDVEKDYVLRSELANVQALLNECQNEIDQIDQATAGVESAMTPLLAKTKQATPKQPTMIETLTGED